jgi:hypothetical protein
VPAVFLGYEPGSKAYRLYDPVAKRVLVSRDVVFDEGRAWDWKSTTEPVVTSEFFVENMDYGGDSSEPAARAAAEEVEPQQPATPGAAEPHTPSATATTDVVEFATPPTAPDPELFDDEDDADEPHRYRRVANLLGPNATGAARAEHLFLTSAEEPASVAEAEQNPSWRKAMLEEMNSIRDNDTWELVDLPRGHKPIGLKWVFKVKRDEHGAMIKHKARLVAKGYV